MFAIQTNDENKVEWDNITSAIENNKIKIILKR